MIAKYYTQISFDRLAELLDFKVDVGCLYSFSTRNIRISLIWFISGDGDVPVQYDRNRCHSRCKDPPAVENSESKSQKGDQLPNPESET